MTPLVIDASVAVKWFMPEAHSDAAIAFLTSGRPLHAPDLIYAEVGNTLWKLNKREQPAMREVRKITRALIRFPIESHSAVDLMMPALEIAAATGASVYDSIYLALAARLRGNVITADRRLVARLEGSPIETLASWIGDINNSAGE